MDWYYASRLLALASDDDIVQRAKERADAVCGESCKDAKVLDAAVVRLPEAVVRSRPFYYRQRDQSALQFLRI